MFSKRGTAKTLRIAWRAFLHSAFGSSDLRPFDRLRDRRNCEVAQGPNPGRPVSLSNRQAYTFSEPKIRTTSLTR